MLETAVTVVAKKSYLKEYVYICFTQFDHLFRLCARSAVYRYLNLKQLEERNFFIQKFFQLKIHNE